MPQPSLIQQTILNAEYKIATLANTNLNLILNGGLAVKEDFINYFRLNLQGLKYQYGQSDYFSTTTVIIYDRLVGFIGIPAGVTVDPNYQNPNQTNIQVPVLIGYNSDKIPFATTDDAPILTLSNYNTVYKQLYGNNPIVAIYDNQGQYIGDEQTPPMVTYQDDDPTKDILSISWSYPIATSGYIQISGVAASGVSGNPSGGQGDIALNFTQADLLQDGNGSWYLPLMLPIGKVPGYVSSNNVQFIPTYDNTFTPARLYGFGNNDTQAILVKII